MSLSEDASYATNEIEEAGSSYTTIEAGSSYKTIEAGSSYTTIEAGSSYTTIEAGSSYTTIEAPVEKTFLDLPQTPTSKSHHIYIFFNSKSGSNGADAYIQSEVAKLRFHQPNVTLRLHDIAKGCTGAKPGFLHIKKIIKKYGETPHFKVFIIAAGGDGTVMWCATELWAHEIDDSKCVIGVIPFGTGNDFARAMKWTANHKKQPFTNKMAPLKVMCREWISSPIILHDVWEVEVEIHNHGLLKRIDGTTRKKIPLLEADTGQPVTLNRMKMNNYFSIGVESRIGIGFDRHRMTNQIANKIVYFNEGLKKAMFKKTVPANAYINEIRQTDSYDGTDGLLICSTDKASLPYLKPPAMSLVFSNIPSIASGLDLWETSKGKPLAVEGSTMKINLRDTPQCMGDGKLQILSLPSTSAWAFERMFQGQSRRVYQGEGPFFMSFKAMEHLRIYFQVDGEFYQMTSPKSVKIRYFKHLQIITSSVTELNSTGRVLQITDDSET